jgi:metal-responsive CopG/Arc/MetJ family transcriptional regulator
MATAKRRTEVVLPKELVERIDQVAGKRGRTKFIEQAAWAELRRRAFEEWLTLGKRLKGLTLEDTLYAARRQLEERGR